MKSTAYIAVCSLAAVQLYASVAGAGPQYHVFASREGLVGNRTSNGHIIVTRDHFVALPSTKSLDCNGCRNKTVAVYYKGRSVTVPVWDVGPWNTKDDYWNSPRELFQGLPIGLPEAQAAYQNGYNGGLDQFGRHPSNPAGIDLADGVFWNDLAMVGNDWVDVTYNFVAGYVVQGAIKVKYDSLGGAASFLGQPTTNELTCPDNIGKYNHFQGGSIYWTQQYGAWSIRGLIRDRWSALGWEAGVCGYPITDENTCPDGVGKYNHFSKGASIYYTPSTGACEIGGEIRNKWSSLGWETGICGYPSNSESPCGDGVGRFNHFSKGCSIYWHPSIGAKQVGGAIRNTWASMGWETGTLGYPISDEYAVAEGRRSDFQKGSLVWNASTGVVSVVGQAPADLILDNAAAGFAVTGAWSTGTSAADKYGADYRYHSTGTTTDAATWAFSTTQARNYDIYAWWSQGTNRSAVAVYTLPGSTTVSVNQQANGGKWNLLGTKSLAVGSNSMKLGTGGATGFIVVADGIKIVAK